jgi:hypothetical protein
MLEATLTAIDDAEAEMLYRNPRPGAYLMSVPVDGTTTRGEMRDSLRFDIRMADDIPDTVSDAVLYAAIDRHFEPFDPNRPFDPFLPAIAPDAAEYVAHAWFQIEWTGKTKPG